MKAILKTPPDPDALKRLSASPFYNVVLRTTAVATMLEAGYAENARAGDRQLPGRCFQPGG